MENVMTVHTIMALAVVLRCSLSFKEDDAFDLFELRELYQFLCQRTIESDIQFMNILSDDAYSEHVANTLNIGDFKNIRVDFFENYKKKKHEYIVQWLLGYYKILGHEVKLTPLPKT